MKAVYYPQITMLCGGCSQSMQGEMNEAKDAVLWRCRNVMPCENHGKVFKQPYRPDQIELEEVPDPVWQKFYAAA